MNRTTVRARVVLLLAPLGFAMSAATSSALACVVGTGTGRSCTEAALDACLPGGVSFDGILTFGCGGARTITVTSTKTISADTSIDGGNLIIISGGGTVGVFAVHPGVTFTVQNLTIVNASNVNSDVQSGQGGAIDNNSGTLSATNSNFSCNTAEFDGGAIHHAGSGTLTINNSTFSGNSVGTLFTLGSGGAIFNYATVTVTNSTFFGNAGGIGGGAIDNRSTVNVTNSTFYGNTALNGGAIANGLEFESAATNVVNSTFSGNGTLFGGDAIASRTGTVTVVNSILANSTSPFNCLPNPTEVPFGTITDGGHNIDDGTTCGFTGANCAMTTGTSFCNTDPLLDVAGPANNGGPTQTIALEAGSPAINVGDETVCAAPPVNNLDQRGFIRPGVGATSCSIGAYEFQGRAPR